MTQNDSTKPKPKLSRLAMISLICLLAALAISILGTVSSGIGFGREGAIRVVGARSAVGGLVAASLLGIAALIAIARSRGHLTGRSRAVFAVLASSWLIGLLAFEMGGNPALTVMCQTNMRGLVNALHVYAKDNDDSLPDADRWCDLLIAKADISPRSLCCPKSNTRPGESSYAMNGAVVGKKLRELPPDMVLLFEVASGERKPTRDFLLADRQYIIDSNSAEAYRERWTWVCRSRWNEACGLEKADVSTHHGGCNILFADGRVEFVRRKDLPSLRWSVDSAPAAPPLRTIVAGFELRHVIPGAITVFAFIFTAILVWRCYRPRSLSIIVKMALMSAGAGLLCGGLSDLLHTASPGWAGAIVGTFAGLLAGVCFAAFVRARSEPISNKGDLWHYLVAVGMATGVIVSTLVHLTLMILYEDAQGGLPIVAGMPFGIVAGAVLGGIACVFIPATDKQIAETTNA